MKQHTQVWIELHYKDDVIIKLYGVWRIEQDYYYYYFWSGSSLKPHILKKQNLEKYQVHDMKG